MSSAPLTKTEVIPSTGVLGTINQIGVGNGPAGCSLSPDGQLLFVSNHTSESVQAYDNDNTGPNYLDLLSTMTVPGARAQLTHPTLPVLYVATSNNQVWTLESNPPTLTSVGPPENTGHDPTQLLLESTGEYLYVICRGVLAGAPSAINVFRVDQVNGTLTEIYNYEFPELQFPSGAVMLFTP